MIFGPKIAKFHSKSTNSRFWLQISLQIAKIILVETSDSNCSLFRLGWPGVSLPIQLSVPAQRFFVEASFLLWWCWLMRKSGPNDSKMHWKWCGHYKPLISGENGTYSLISVFSTNCDMGNMVCWSLSWSSAPNTLTAPSPGIVFLDFSLGDKG